MVIGLIFSPEMIELRPGMLITRSVRVKPGEYLLSSSDEAGISGAVTVRGRGITVDMTGVVLRGTPATVEPNERKGTGIFVEGENVTLRGVSVHGYKLGLVARGVRGMRLIDADFSYNWKARLASGREREDVGDWMSFHRNEKDEWLRYGAAVYFRGCDDFEVRGVRARGGQCGLMLMESNRGLVWNSDFSFMSAVGVGLYLSSDNRVMHNSIDWCLRGYQHQFYNRGQDSTGILIYEQSHRNVFAYNSVTHGGDGFFLWAGQTTMDTGQGGCNDNVVYGNDFSHAPTNGIEATFSRNVFADNLILECWHGIWGGYSYETVIAGNVFGLNGEAIAIEHGQDNKIIGNVFRRDTVGIYLWSNEREDPDWGYPKKRDTRSRDTVVAQNIFYDIPGIAFDLRRTQGLVVRDNFIKRTQQVFQLAGDVRGLVFTGNTVTTPNPLKARAPRFEGEIPGFVEEGANLVTIGGESAPSAMFMQRRGLVAPGMSADLASYRKFLRGLEWNPMVRPRPLTKSLAESTPDEVRRAAAAPYWVEPLEGGIVPFLGPDARRGRWAMIVDEWGPYDFRSPKLWLRDVQELGDGSQVLVFETLGRPGRWRILRRDGVTAVGSAESVRMEGILRTPPFVPDNLDRKWGESSGEIGQWLAVRTPGGPLDLELEYVGVETVDYRGIRTAAGQPVLFGYRRDDIAIDWVVRFWGYDRATEDPRTQAPAFARVFERAPLVEFRTRELNGSWPGAPAAGVPADGFTTRAEGTFRVPAGEYILSVTSDDGVRVRLDGRVVVEDWTWHAPKTDEARVRLGGDHRLEVEHFELDGFSTLRVEIRRVR